MKPYYSADGLTVYHAKWEDIIGLVQVDEIALIHADPPYGQSERTDRGAKGRGKSSAGSNALTKARNFPTVVGDDKPFDPAPLLDLDRPTVMWGAQRYARLLPMSPSWLWWGKRDGVLPDDNGDGELAWTNLGGPMREFQHLWKGAIRASERNAPHVHSTQKPIALSTFVFNRAKLKRGDLVFVPYLGSGPDLPAAREMGLRIIACDVEQWCCETAVQRIGAEVEPSVVQRRVVPLCGATTVSLMDAMAGAK